MMKTLTKKPNHIASTLLFDVDSTFFNGGNPQKSGKADVSMPKYVEINGYESPYISAQSYRYYLKKTFQKLYKEKITQDNSLEKFEQVQFSATDDIFGYFYGDEVKHDDKDIGQFNISQIRQAPFLISQLHPIEIINNDISNHQYFSSDDAFVHLKGNSTPLPYNSKFYSAIFTEIFNIDIKRIGQFSNFLDRQEITEKIALNAIKKKILEKIDSNSYKLTNYEKNVKMRLETLFEAIMCFEGGAKQSQYLSNLAPNIIIIDAQSGSTPIFSDVFRTKQEGVELNLSLFKNKFLNSPFRRDFPLFFGVRKGFLTNYEDLKNWIMTQKLENKIILNSPGYLFRFLQELNLIE